MRKAEKWSLIPVVVVLIVVVALFGCPTVGPVDDFDESEPDVDESGPSLDSHVSFFS